MSIEQNTVGIDKDEDAICVCGCPSSFHEERTHEVERGSHYCRQCNSIHDLDIKKKI